MNLYLSVINDAAKRHPRATAMEFDAGELSMCSYIVAKSNGCALTAVPVFPHRRFPHSNILINVRSGIDSPRDLRGKKIGIQSLHTTWALWAAGILDEFYGVSNRDIQWFSSNRGLTGEEIPTGVSVSQLPSGKDLYNALVERQVDAVISSQIQRSLSRKHPDIRRLFPNFKEEEKRYYEQSGLFPIMHVIAVKESVVREHPWVARSLMEAFDASQKACNQFMDSFFSLSLAWYRDLLEEEQAFFEGQNIWACGMKENRKNVETMVRYARRLGLIKKEMPVESLFAAAVTNS